MPPRPSAPPDARPPSRVRRWIAPIATIAVAALLVAGAFLGHAALRREVARGLQTAVTAWPGGWQLAYADLSLRLREPRIRLAGVRLTSREAPSGLTAERLEIFGALAWGGARRDLAVNLDGWQTALAEGLLAPLAALAPGAARLRLAERPPDRLLLRAWAGAGGGGELFLALELGGLTLERAAAAAAHPWQLAFALAGASAVGGALDYREEGLAEALLQAAARRRGLTPAALRRALVEELDRRLRQTDAAALARVLAAARDFTARPSAIQLRAAPAAPVPLARLLWRPEPSAWVEALGVTAAIPDAAPAARTPGPPAGLLPGDP